MAKGGTGRRGRVARAELPHNVFLTWSGKRSKIVALALRKWLPTVVQQSRPWLSAQDIHAGQRWRAEIDGKLGSSGFGVLCLTRENVAEPWVNFEAGAISAAVGAARVVPYCFDFKPTDYSDPLGGFQGVEADRDGTLSLVRSINSVMPAPLEKDVLEQVFDRSWHALKAELDAIPREEPDEHDPRSEKSILIELLTRVRELQHGPPPGTILRDVVTLAPGSFYPVGPRYPYANVADIYGNPLSSYAAAINMIAPETATPAEEPASRVLAPAEVDALAEAKKAAARARDTGRKKKSK